MVGHRRTPDDGPLLGRRSLSRTEGRPGLRGGHPHRHPGGRPLERSPQEGLSQPERDYPIHRRLLGRSGGGRHLHPAGHLHPGPGCQLHADGPLLTAGRRTGYPLPHPLPEILRQGDARQVPLPRSNGHHAGAGQRRERRQERQNPCAQRSDRRSLRLCRGHLRHLGGDHQHHRDPLGRRGCRQGETGPETQYRRGRAGSRLYRRPQICFHHLLRLVPRLAGDHPAHQPDLGSAGA